MPKPNSRRSRSAGTAGTGWRDRLSIPGALLVALAVVVAATLVVTASTSSAVYGPYNSEWDGTTDLRRMAESTGMQVEVARNTGSYSSVPPSETVAFVLSPDSPYRSGELAQITNFVRSGGTLVVADDFGPHANELLAALDASARIDGRPVRDVRSNYRSTAMPVATAVADHPVVAGVDSVTLNYGTVVEPNGATPLVNTSEDAYVDADRNGNLSANETLGNHTVATVERVGDGRVIVVGDSSAFINAMLDRPGNRAFARALLSRHGTLLLDYSHTGTLPALALAVLAIRESAALKLGLGVVAVGALTVWSRRPDLFDLDSLEFGSNDSGVLASISRLWREDSSLREARTSSTSGDRASGSADDANASPAELADYLERRHPDWDRERIERVVSAVERRRNR